ncbi:MAG: fibro-slime domain-containing protein [Fibrobacter sp.]|nr:fibro-slime domain-containing protein [Fibrobacter sp.]
MRNFRKVSFWKFAVSVGLLLVGAQGVCAQQVCKGTVLFKAPEDWTGAYIGGFNVNDLEPMVLNPENGYYEFDLETLGIKDKLFFAIGNQATPAGSKVVRKKGFGIMPSNGANDANWPTNDADIPCPGEGKKVFVLEDPKTKGKTYVGELPPNAKYLFMMIPADYTEWLSADPMISMDGGVTGVKLDPVKDHCGWFQYIWFGETISDNVVFFSSADVARTDLIGLNGNWEEPGNPATPIPLGMLFKMKDTLYFVPDQEELLTDSDDGWYYTFPGIEGTCSYELAAIIYDTDASLHGAFTCATTYYKDMPGAEGKYNGCPTNAPFSYPAGQPTPCIGVTQGIVADLLDPTTKKPTYNPASGCFVSAEAFNTMFQSDTRYNETYCVEMPFTRSADGKWEFDSDNYTSPGATAKGGFYPGESAITDPTKMLSAAVPAAHNKRKAEGPVFMESSLRKINAAEGVPEIDILCNGPGWNKGIDCNRNHLFSGGGEWSSTNPPKAGLAVKGDGWQWSVMGDGWANDDAPEGWTFYKEGTETAVNVANTTGGYGSGNAARWASGGWVKDDKGKAAVQAYDATVFTNGQGRNQHFCFESHAKFTYRKGLRFSFRGDDDIWIFIDNKLAVDIGGTHLAAPGYVDLDYFVGASGGFNVGSEYDLDIFFCDRRTTMSNVRIKTNMYIRQKTDIETVGKKNPANMNETIYDVCYTKSGDGSCAAAMSAGNSEKYCGPQLVDAMNAGLISMSYTLVEGKKKDENVVAGFENVTAPGVYMCGIDLTNFGDPVLNKSALCMRKGGYYTLFVNIDGKSKKVMGFQTSGEMSVIYKNGSAMSINSETGDVAKLGDYTPKTIAMGGEMVPVYISNVAPRTGTDSLDIFPDDAVNQPYALAYDMLMKVYEKQIDPATGTETYVKIVSGATRNIGPSGIDTVYVTVDMEDLTEPIQTFSISVGGKADKAQNISFYLPQITFIEKIPEPGETAKSITGQQPEPDGSYEELWVGTQYEMYLAIVKPNLDKTYSPCLEECNGITIHKGAGTSPKIDFMPEQVTFVNGYASVQVRSMVKYRWDTDPSIHSPATIVAEYNDYVQAVYNPVYFRDPPVPFPVLADVFDAHGSVPPMEYKIPAPYFDVNTEYLDGIGDSIAIYYDRAIHKDSLPTRICVLWDTTEAEAHNPYAEGFSTIPKDSAITCNVLVPIDARNIDCSHPSADGYCTKLVTVGGLKLSSAVKTMGLGEVRSYAEFEDKGKKVKQGFKGALTDRMAPVPLRAEVRTILKDDELTDRDSLVLILSEPVKFVTSSNKKTSLDFYLNSAVELSDDSRYVSALSGAQVVTSDNDPLPSVVSETGEGRVKFMYRRGNVSPHVGDYLRLGGDLTNIFWSDTTDLSLLGGDTLRPAADADYHWNSPTAYNETLRLPSIWIPVTGDAEIDVTENKFASTANADSVWMATHQAVTVNGYRTNMTKAEILAQEGGRPGHLVKADMYAIFNGLTAEEKAEIMQGNLEDVFFYYEVQYYTNLGGFVTRKSQKIYCSDDLNIQKNGQSFFGGAGTSCIDGGMDRNYFIGWNMRSENGRMAGTGAYIVKLNSYVKMGPAGKKAKQESTSIWGVKRSPKPDRGYMKATSK